MTPLRNGGETFRIVFSELIRESIDRLQDQAIEQQRGEAFLAALKLIVTRLSSVARVAGEAQYRLPALRVQVRQIAIRPFTVHYAVSDDRAVVYIKGVSLMSSGAGPAHV